LAVFTALAWSGAVSAPAQYIPYYGKNKVKYDNFAWRVYKSPHFEIYYYPEFEPHLGRVISYAESAYQKISGDLKHNITSSIPLILYKTHAEFEQTNLFPDFVPEGVAAFAEPQRNRIVLPIDEAPDRLQGLITHELTHVFEFDLIPRSLIQRQVPLWVDEGLADYMRAAWDPLDLMMIRDAALSDQVPKLSRLADEYDFSNPRMIYNLGHAAFEFFQVRYGKEGIRQFLYTLRKNMLGGKKEDVYRQAFRSKPEEIDEAFDRWLQERFKPYRDKQRPSDYGQEIAPDEEKTVFSQVYAFSPSPSGEILAALTGNRADGEADIVLLSAKDGRVLKNLTKGFSGRYEDISFAEEFSAGRSLHFDPKGDSVAFFARTGKKRSLFVVSVLSGNVERSIPIDLDLPQSPCLSPDGRHALFSAIRNGSADIYQIDLETREIVNLTNDAFRDTDPQLSPDGSLVVYSRRVGGHYKLMILPLANPRQKTQLTFGVHDDQAPIFALDGKRIYYASNDEGDISNVRSLDLRTGVIHQYTDAIGGAMAPALLKDREGEKLAFVCYFKGQFRLRTLDAGQSLKEVEQEIETASADQIDFEPNFTHRVIPENKRRKRTFEKVRIENRPPLNVGVTSGGDFFGGSQLALADVLGDHNLQLSVLSVREYRSYDGTYYNLSRRLNWGLSVFDTTTWGYADPYGDYYTTGFSREGALTSQRYTGASFFAQYPLDKYRRLHISAGYLRLQEGFASVESEAFMRASAAAMGVPIFLNNGSVTPLSLALIGETTRFHGFGPLAGSTYALGVQAAPGLGTMLSRVTLDLDARKYFRLFPTTVFATRVRGFRSTGRDPDYFFFGGNMELRGYPYLAFAGNEGFFANAELRFPLIDIMKTPLGLMGPVRGTLYAGVGGARFRGQKFQFGTRQAGVSYVNDAWAGEAVSGYHLVDGRASYGAGIQFFVFGYPLHFDWSKLTDLKVASKKTYFNFWMGFDF
jgi:hypothetical protein